MTKLNQLVAVEKGLKSTVNRRWTDCYHQVGKSALLAGLQRTYTPKEEDGDQLPPESVRVQIDVEDVLVTLGKDLGRLFDVVSTKDNANCEAKADVKLSDGSVLLHDVPVSTLLYLEKQLTDLHTFCAKLPVLDPAENWTRDENANVYKTDAVQTTRTKKVPKAFVKAPATDKHPAQVEMFHEDVIAGTWTLVKHSGAIPATRRVQLVDRVEELQRAVKFAREAANTMEITDKLMGKAVFDYLFAR
jgi:hypothetical protein